MCKKNEKTIKSSSEKVRSIWKQLFWAYGAGCQLFLCLEFPLEREVTMLLRSVRDPGVPTLPQEAIVIKNVLNCTMSPKLFRSQSFTDYFSKVQRRVTLHTSGINLLFALEILHLLFFLLFSTISYLVFPNLS